MKKFKTVDAYFSALPDGSKTQLLNLRRIIRSAAPKAEEVISYNMPAFREHGMLVYYAAFRNHIGFFPTSNVLGVLKDELKDYQTSKGTLRFSLEGPLPVTLIKKIVRYRLKENNEKEKLKKNKSKKKK